MLLKDIPENEETECENTEDLISILDEVNQEGLDDGYIIGSMDVKSLYPSLDIKHTIQIVCEMFEASNTDISGIDFEEIVFYIATTMDQEEIDRLGIADICPKRKSRIGRRPKITGCGTVDDKKKRYAPYIMPDVMQLSDVMRRKLIAIAMQIALTFVMRNHVYVFDEELRKQREGGAIGLELTGLLARIYMIWWDKRFLQICAQNQVIVKIYKRYVDDINILLKYIGHGYRYNGTEVVRDPEKAEVDRNRKKDEVMMELMNEIGDSIHPSIQLTTDYPSKNQDEKIPILNLKVWTEQNEEDRTNIIYEHYRKEQNLLCTRGQRWE